MKSRDTRGKDDREKGSQGYSSGLDKDHPALPRSQNQDHVGIAKQWGRMIKERNLPISFYFYILLVFVGFFILLPQMDGLTATLGGSRIEQAPRFTIVEVINPDTTARPLQITLNTELNLPERTENIPLPERTDRVEKLMLPKRTETLTLPEGTEDLTLPETSKRTENLTLPERTKRTENITLSERTENLTLPEKSENLSRAERIDTLNLTERLETKENFTLPEKVENITLPDRTKNLTLPERLERTENLTLGETTENLTLPRRIKNLTLPKRIEGTENLTLPERIEHPLICPPRNVTQTCPLNPISTNILMQAKYQASSSMETETCPDYFRWIHEDLKPWKEKGITREAVEAGKKVASFRLVVLEGRVYVETYQKSYHTRDVFTIWGIVQLLRVYPGKVPNLDLMFECGDHPVISKAAYAANSSAPLPPIFGYCVDDFSFDIPLPDWSFWGWHEINIKPWEALVEDLKEANERVKWVDRVPYAFWKGNIAMGRRRVLLRCNSTEHWSAQIFRQNWDSEVKHGFRESNLADQCNHRYKIYMEGKAWSVSEKYLQACDSMLLLVQPRYYEFFTRSLVPLKHYWPIDPWKLCVSIKFAVDWGNIHPKEAEEIGKAGSNFIMEELKMKYIYDYLFHVLSDYGKLLNYKPTVPPGALEVCLESMVCNSSGKEKQAKIDSMAKGPSQTGPCTMPPPYDPQHLQKFLSLKNDISGKLWRGQVNIRDMRITT